MVGRETLNLDIGGPNPSSAELLDSVNGNTPDSESGDFRSEP